MFFDQCFTGEERCDRGNPLRLVGQSFSLLTLHKNDAANAHAINDAKTLLFGLAVRALA
jgi:hypothetical protein